MTTRSADRRLARLVLVLAMVDLFPFWRVDRFDLKVIGLVFNGLLALGVMVWAGRMWRALAVSLATVVALIALHAVAWPPLMLWIPRAVGLAAVFWAVATRWPELVRLEGK
jgi:hypothetical protein